MKLQNRNHRKIAAIGKNGKSKAMIVSYNMVAHIVMAKVVKHIGSISHFLELDNTGHPTFVTFELDEISNIFILSERKE